MTTQDTRTTAPAGYFDRLAIACRCGWRGPLFDLERHLAEALCPSCRTVLLGSGVEAQPRYTDTSPPGLDLSVVDIPGLSPAPRPAQPGPGWFRGVPDAPIVQAHLDAHGGRWLLLQHDAGVVAPGILLDVVHDVVVAVVAGQRAPLAIAFYTDGLSAAAFIAGAWLYPLAADGKPLLPAGPAVVMPQWVYDLAHVAGAVVDTWAANPLDVAHGVRLLAMTLEAVRVALPQRERDLQAVVSHADTLVAALRCEDAEDHSSEASAVRALEGALAKVRAHGAPVRTRDPDSLVLVAKRLELLAVLRALPRDQHHTNSDAAHAALVSFVRRVDTLLRAEDRAGVSP